MNANIVHFLNWYLHIISTLADKTKIVIITNTLKQIKYDTYSCLTTTTTITVVKHLD